MYVSPKLKSILDRLAPEAADFTPEVFARWIEEFDDCRVHFIPMDLPPGVFGACLVVTGEQVKWDKYVLYDSKLPATHQAHVKTHELAHLALGHKTVSLSPEQMEAIMLHPELVVDHLSVISCRSSAPSFLSSERNRAEQEAELLTRLIYHQAFAARQKRQLRPISSQADLDEALRRMGIE